MHPENKLPNHGKQVAGDAQSQIPNVNQQEQQGPATNQGSKGTGPGNHGVKSSQISPGLKSVGGMMKTKSKRERSISVDAGEQKDQLALAPVLESDAKGMSGTGHVHALSWNRTFLTLVLKANAKETGTSSMICG